MLRLSFLHPALILYIVLISTSGAYCQSSIGGTVNTISTPVTSLINSSSISVQSASGFSPNDTVLIIQMKGAISDTTNTASFGNIVGFGDAGNNEFAVICSVSGNTISFQNSMVNSYSPAGGYVQLIRVDTYNDVDIVSTLTAPAWNGFNGTGGVLAIVASGTITLNADISMNGKGFRGGWSQSNYSACSCGCSPSDPQFTDYYFPSGTCRAAGKGEGIVDSIPGKEFGRGKLANGGGGGNDHNAGGGGGGNFTAGGTGGTASAPSCFFGPYCRGNYPGQGSLDLNTAYVGTDKLFLGGGGGAGHANNLAGMNGGAGGGIIIILANAINGQGYSISTTGMNVTTYNDGDGQGGGGAGGAVALNVNTINGALNIDVSGGQGGNVDSYSASNCKGPGGGGGAGVIRTSIVLPGSVTTDLSGGLSGVQTGTFCTGSTNGALSASNGSVLNGYSISIGGSSAPSSVDTQVACESFVWIDGNIYSSSNNTATWTLTNAAGCDSTVQLDLTILSPATGTDVVVTCGSYLWIDGNTYTSSTNTPTHTFIGGAANGCDSIVTLDLTLTTYATGIDNQTACGSYNWIDGMTYSSSTNTPTYTYINGAANGCDSIVTLNLTINNSTNGTDVVSACGSYTWINGTTYTSSTNSPIYTIPNGAANGCDSIVTLNLTITTFASGTDVVSACNSHTWLDGITYSASTNTPTYTFVGGASNGCDSIVTLDLTIANSNSGTDVIIACDSYTWIDGNTYTSNNNTATFSLMNVSGCDSLVTLDLTISNSSNGTDVISACEPYTWIDGVTYTSSNNTATWLLTNTAGCDSLVTLELTMNSMPANIVVQNNITLTALQSGATYQWLNCDDNYSIISNATSQQFTPSSPTGNYAVEINLNGCIDTSVCYYIDYSGISEEFKNILFVNPNPATDVLVINGIDEVAGINSMQISTLNGQTVLELTGKHNEINVGHLPSGMYYLRIYHNAAIESIRFVKL